MKYIINADCYLVDDKSNVTNLTNPTFDVNFESKTDAATLKTELKKKLRELGQYVVIKESLTENDKEASGTVNENTVYYEAYVGKTGRETLPKKK